MIPYGGDDFPTATTGRFVPVRWYADESDQEPVATCDTLGAIVITDHGKRMGFEVSDDGVLGPWGDSAYTSLWVAEAYADTPDAE